MRPSSASRLLAHPVPIEKIRLSPAQYVALQRFAQPILERVGKFPLSTTIGCLSDFGLIELRRIPITKASGATWHASKRGEEWLAYHKDCQINCRHGKSNDVSD